MAAAPAAMEVRPGRRNFLVDRRGNTVPLLTVSDLPPEAPALVVQAVRLANLHRSWPQFRIFLFVWGGLVLLSLGLRYGFGVRISPVLWWILVIAFSGRVASYGGRRNIRANAMNAYTLCMAADICPSCGYGIKGVPRQDEGVAVCPECAGAWDTRVSASRPAP